MLFDVGVCLNYTVISSVLFRSNFLLQRLSLHPHYLSPVSVNE